LQSFEKKETGQGKAALEKASCHHFCKQCRKSSLNRCKKTADPAASLFLKRTAKMRSQVKIHRHVPIAGMQEAAELVAG
jgi:hypothetical protein